MNASRGSQRLTDLEHQANLLRAVADAAVVLSREPDLYQATASAARILGEATGVDRLNVLRYEPAREAAFLFAEWCRDNVPPLSTIGVGPFGVEDYQEVFRPVMAGEIYHSPLAAKSGASRALNLASTTKTDLHVPVFAGETFWGLLNFDDCTTERTWTDGEIEVLRAAAEALASAINRERAERERAEAIAQERERIVQHRAITLQHANDALQQTVDAAAQLNDFTELVPAVLRIVASAFGSECCAYFSHPAGEPIRLQYWYRLGEVLNVAALRNAPFARNEIMQRLLDGFVAPDDYLGTPHRDRSRAILVNHLHGTTEPDFDAFAVENDWAMELNVPLVVDGKADGALVLYRPADQSYSEEEIELVEALAKQLALAMKMERLANRLASEHGRAAVLEERNRLARDIHDTLAQGFTGVIMQLEAAQGALEKNQAEAVANRLELATSLARSSLTEARRSVRALRPRSLALGSLCSALNDLVQGIAPETRLRADFVLEGQPYPLPPLWEENLLRIAQESLTNTIKHAEARHFQVALRFLPQAVELQALDDGRGFVSDAFHDGFGLTGMTDRVKSMDGTIAVRSKPGEGTEIAVYLPRSTSMHDASSRPFR